MARLSSELTLTHLQISANDNGLFIHKFLVQMINKLFSFFEQTKKLPNG